MPYEWEEWAMRALEGIEPHEVWQVLEGKHAWPRPAVGATGRVLTLWGRTPTGRALVVAVYHVSGFTWKIIGARDLADNELAEFSTWEETR